MIGIIFSFSGFRSIKWLILKLIIKAMSPIKRSKELQPFSHDHHDALLLCWKIRNGLSKGVERERIKSYSEWFYRNHLVKHFEEEEKYLFPVLGNQNELVGQALREHKRLHELFGQKDADDELLTSIANELEAHIRFEERILFNEIQKAASEKDLQLLQENVSHTTACENWNDHFWDRKT
jgi:hypothetical protein